MNQKLQGPMQSAFSRLHPKSILAPVQGPEVKVPLTSFKAVAATSKGRQIYNAMLATPGRPVRFYSEATGVGYSNTYMNLMRMKEAGFAAQTMTQGNISGKIAYWRATGQWDEDAWNDVRKPTGTRAKHAVSQRPALVQAPPQASSPEPMLAPIKAGYAPVGIAESNLAPEKFNLENLTIREARSLYAELKKLFG